VGVQAAYVKKFLNFFGIPLLFVTYDKLNMLYKFQSYMIMFTDSSTTPKFTKVDSIVLLKPKRAVDVFSHAHIKIKQNVMFTAPPYWVV